MCGMPRRRVGIFAGSFLLASLFLLSVYNVNTPAECSPSSTFWSVLMGSCQKLVEKCQFSPEIDGQNLAMSKDQCDTSFPGLFKEIDRMVEKRQGQKIALEELEQQKLKESYGYTRAMIYDNRLYIIDTNGGLNTRNLATLHSLHLAIATSPVRLPNCEFVFTTFDSIEANILTWAFARNKNEENGNTWLMPDFGHWSWPEPKVGSFVEALIKADEIDKKYLSPEARKDGEPYTLHGKVEKLVWRGAAMGLVVREGLLSATKDKSWADVRTLDWGNPETIKNDYLSMADHCKYKFLAHVEGQSYSGRLKYLQVCNSVVVAHKLDWVQHHHPLMISGGSEQNFVEVRRDWSDLEQQIDYLIQNPDEAEKIARRSREVWRRYLSPAATNCYWRRLFEAWGNLLDFQPQFYKEGSAGEWRGVAWESYALLQKLTWDPM